MEISAVENTEFSFHKGIKQSFNTEWIIKNGVLLTPKIV